jgi:hypothetical protein
LNDGRISQQLAGLGVQYMIEEVLVKMRKDTLAYKDNLILDFKLVEENEQIELDKELDVQDSLSSKFEDSFLFFLFLLLR